MRKQMLLGVAIVLFMTSLSAAARRVTAQEPVKTISRSANQAQNCASPVECSATKPALDVRNIGNGAGVSGFSNGGSGVLGKSGFGPGVTASSDTGPEIIVGYSFSEIAEGDVKVFSLGRLGDVRATGSFMNRSLDFAEMTEVEVAPGLPAGSYEPGDVLIISPKTGKLKTCQQPYCPLVAGIYSTHPGFLGGRGIGEDSASNKVPLALVGQVPCKVTTENGPIQIGDLLVTSSTTGYAMKGTDRSLMLGAIVAKALEPLASGAGIIKVLVTLQ